MAEFVQGDSGILSLTIQNGNSVIDLTNTTVTVSITYSQTHTGTVKSATITDAINGKCQITLTSNDLLLDGVYVFQAQVKFSDGSSFSSNVQKFSVAKKLGFIPVIGGNGGTIDVASGDNGHILVNGLDVKVYDDTPVKTDITDLQSKQVTIGSSSTNGNINVNGQDINIFDDTNISNRLNTIENSDVIKRLGVSSNNKLTIDNMEQVGGNGSGALVFNTLTDLQNAYPNGTTQPAWVIADNEWYYWDGVITVDTTPPTVTVSPTAGTYNTNQSITLTANETATIYYTIDGTTPTESSTVYSTPISITATTTIKYFAKDTAGNSSTIQSVTYTIDKVAPTITASSSGGTFTSAQTVTLSSNESNTTIYYTLDGSTPTTSSTIYSSALTINSTSTLKFFGKDIAGNQSAVQSISFTINAPDTTAPTVTISPVAGTFISTQSVTLSANETATIYYTLDGSTPTTSSTVYSSPISISATTTIKYFAKDTAGNSSVVQTATYTINLPDTTAPNPVTNLTAGTVTSSSIPVSWTLSNSNDVVNYEVAYSSNGGSSYTVASALVNASSISYTVNGLTASTAYVIRVIAIDGAGNRSTPVTVNASTIAAPDTTPPVITASPAAGTYTSSQSVTLSSNESNTTIYYTTDGSTPTTSSTVYSGPITVSATKTIQFIGKDGAGNVSTPVAATYTINAASNFLPNATIYDSFNRADNASSLGTSDSGHIWVYDSQVWGISGNKARPYSGTADKSIYIDSGKSDCTVQCTFASALGTAAATAHRMTFRWQDTTHYFAIQATTTGYTLWLQNGGWTSLATSSGFTPAQGDVVKVVLSGSSITVFANGTQIISVTNTNYQTATKHGLAIGNASTTTILYDDFSVA